MRLNNSIIKILLIATIFTTIHATTLKELRADPRYQAEIAEMDAIKINKKFSSFRYDKDFAKAGKLDPSKAITLPEHIHAVGVSVVERKAETEETFAEYNCMFHFVLKNKKDYWLPKDRYGSWFDLQQLSYDIQNLFGKIEIEDGDITSDYVMREFFNKGIPNPLPNTQLTGGSVFLNKFMRDIYPGMTYVEFQYGCYNLDNINKGMAVYLEKKGRPDFKYERVPMLYKFFYELAIPQEILKESCSYFKKAKVLRDWNLTLTSIYFKNILKETKKIYSCDN